jgi:hypothetical protein
VSQRYSSIAQMGDLITVIGQVVKLIGLGKQRASQRVTTAFV